METTLFFSPKCQQSVKIINYLEVNSLVRFVRRINLDIMSTSELQQLNLQFRVIPTIIVKTSGGYAIHEGKRKCWEFLEQIIKGRRESMISIASGRMSAANADRGLGQGPVGYKESEMSGGDDDYTFLDMDVPLIKNHRPFIRDGENDQIVLLTMDKDLDKIKGDEAKKMMSEIEKQRRSEDSHVKQVNERQQIDCYLDRNM